MPLRDPTRRDHLEEVAHLARMTPAEIAAILSQRVWELHSAAQYGEEGDAWFVYRDDRIIGSGASPTDAVANALASAP